MVIKKNILLYLQLSGYHLIILIIHTYYLLFYFFSITSVTKYSCLNVNHAISFLILSVRRPMSTNFTLVSQLLVIPLLFCMHVIVSFKININKNFIKENRIFNNTNIYIYNIIKYKYINVFFYRYIYLLLDVELFFVLILILNDLGN